MASFSSVVILLFSLFVFGGAQAPLSCVDVPFITRSEWRAGPPKAIASVSKPKLSFYIVHHIKEEPNCYDDRACSASLRSIQQRHQNNLSWVDVGFHFIIGENGKVYEGRGWRREGAHSRHWNRQSLGIAVIGDFTFSSPNAAAVKALEAWMNCGVELGYVDSNYYIMSHLQAQLPGHTICPGFGVLQIIQSFPRFCPFENQDFGENLNETKIATVENYCREKLRVRGQVTSKAAGTYFYTCMTIILLVVIGVI